jgi:hypothetical protein
MKKHIGCSTLFLAIGEAIRLTILSFSLASRCSARLSEERCCQLRRLRHDHVIMVELSMARRLEDPSLPASRGRVFPKILFRLQRMRIRGFRLRPSSMARKPDVECGRRVASVPRYETSGP